MPEKPTELQFDFENYLASLMEAMNMQEAPPEVQKNVTYELGRQLAFRIINTLTLHSEAEDWSNLLNFSDTTELDEVLSKAIEASPKIKDAIVDELDAFYTETIEAFEVFAV